jgi:hypothetical protein
MVYNNDKAAKKQAREDPKLWETSVSWRFPDPLLPVFYLDTSDTTHTFGNVQLTLAFARVSFLKALVFFRAAS